MKPPMLPAMDDPTRFLEMLRSTRAEVEVFSTELTMCAGTMAWKVLVIANEDGRDLTSATTDFPLPSTQLTAAGFLSVQKFPEREIISMSGKTS